LQNTEATRASLLEYTDIPESKITVIPLGVSPHFKPCEPHRIGELRQQLGVRPRCQGDPPGGYPRPVQEHPRACSVPSRSCGREWAPPSSLSESAFRRIRTRADLAARLGVSDGILLAGVVPDDALADWYRAGQRSGVSVALEGFGWPPPRGNGVRYPGRRVNGSRPIQEIVLQTAALVDPEDDDALADALEHVITDDAYAQQLRTLGLARARQLTWAETARKTLVVYDEGRGGRRQRAVRILGFCEGARHDTGGIG